jgi:IGR protein motif
MRAPPIPSPIPFVPDHPTFLKLIGRSLSRYSAKFTSWDDMFQLSSRQLRERGIEPARDRRYLLHWREKYRRGEFGIGGDMRFVEDGVCTLRVVELPRLPEKLKGRAEDSLSEEGSTSSASSSSSLMTKLILNLPAAVTEPTAVLEEGQSTFDLRKVQGVKLAEGHRIQGPYVLPSKGSNGRVATLKIQEGLWEHRRGHKVDGGERRKAEVRFKRGVEERRKARV